jgi:MFS family permease
MKPTISAVRAIGAAFARRALLPFIIIGAIVVVGLLVLGGWLTTQSGWWWLLEALFIVMALIFTALVVIVHILLRAVAPTLTKNQKQQVSNFVDKLERVAEHVQTPQLIIIFNVVRDTIHPRQGSFIEEVSRDSKDLAPDFVRLRREFE